MTTARKRNEILCIIPPEYSCFRFDACLDACMPTGYVISASDAHVCKYIPACCHLQDMPGICRSISCNRPVFHLYRSRLYHAFTPAMNHGQSLAFSAGHHPAHEKIKTPYLRSSFNADRTRNSRDTYAEERRSSEKLILTAMPESHAILPSIPILCSFHHRNNITFLKPAKNHEHH